MPSTITRRTFFRAPSLCAAALLFLPVAAVVATAICPLRIGDPYRTDAQIAADQKTDQAKKEAAQKEQQRQYQKLAKQLGVD